MNVKKINFDLFYRGTAISCNNFDLQYGESKPYVAGVIYCANISKKRSIKKFDQINPELRYVGWYRDFAILWIKGISQHLENFRDPDFT